MIIQQRGYNPRGTRSWSRFLRPVGDSELEFFEAVSALLRQPGVSTIVVNKDSGKTEYRWFS